VDEGFRGSDNDRSIFCQVREGSPAGPVLTEKLLKRYREDWDVLGDGRRHLMQHCHAGPFGVPKGALIGGRRVPHENVFAAAWYRSPRGLGEPGYTDGSNLVDEAYEKRLYENAFFVEWVQFRLNDAENDIEILQPPCQLRQVGYEEGDRFCAAEEGGKMNRWYVPPAPYADDCSEWVQVPHFQHGIAAVRFACNGSTGRYEWVQTGPLLRTGEQTGLAAGAGRLQLTETSTVRYKDRWLILARSAERMSKTVRGVAWLCTDDLFKPLPDPVFPGEPLSKSPCSAFICADGVLRLFTNDPASSPYGDDRNPLYVWDVDPDNGFRVSNRRTVFDAVAAGLKAREESWPRVDMPNLLPHAGGDKQWLTFRVRLRRRKYPFTRLVDEEKRRAGCYAAVIKYEEEAAGGWRFE
jgi:hypothetical protein